MQDVKYAPSSDNRCHLYTALRHLHSGLRGGHLFGLDRLPRGIARSRIAVLFHALEGLDGLEARDQVSDPGPLKHRVEEQVKRDVLGVLTQPLGVDGGLLQRGQHWRVERNWSGPADSAKDILGRGQDVGALGFWRHEAVAVWVLVGHLLSDRGAYLELFVNGA